MFIVNANRKLNGEEREGQNTTDHPGLTDEE